MSAAEEHVQQTGMWAPYVPPEIGEKLDELDKIGSFVLLEAKVREGVATEYGPRDAVDLRVATTEAGKARVFSGFAAGIVGQCKRIGAGDLPAVCRVIESTTGRGKTRGLELIQLVPAGADVAAIAKGQPVPIAPIQPAGGDDIPY